MVSENKEQQKRSGSESIIQKLMRGIIKTIFWSYLSLVLIFIGISIGLGVILYHYTTVYHVMKVLQVFSVAVLGILCLGILFKSSRRRIIALPLVVLGASFFVQNLIGHLPTPTRFKHSAIPTVASDTSKERIFQNTLSKKTDDIDPEIADNTNDVLEIASNNNEEEIFKNPLSEKADDNVSEIAVDIKDVPDESIYSNSLKIITEEPILTFNIDQDSTSYANVRGYLNRNKLPPRKSVRVEEMINHFPYHYALPETKEQPFIIQTTLTESPWKRGNKLLHIGVKGYEQETAQFPIADDTKIQVEFNPVKVAEYHLIGYETHPTELGNSQIDAGKINTGYTVTAIYEITPTAEPLPPNQSEGTALVRVKYKLPGETTSEIIEQTIAETTELDNASDDVRFAIAVAAFGEKLKGGKSVDWTWKDIRNFAKSAQSEDKNRQELITLIKKAEDLIKAEKYDPNC